MNFQEFSQQLSGYNDGSILFFIIIIWSLIWKGIALWKSARRGEKGWFIVMFIINTFGILEILYIFYFSTKSWDNFVRKLKLKKRAARRKKNNRSEKSEKDVL